MMTRLHIQNATHFAEWADTNTGRLQAKAFRRFHPEFKRRKIRSVIQAYPEQIACGTIYALKS